MRLSDSFVVKMSINTCFQHTVVGGVPLATEKTIVGENKKYWQVIFGKMNFGRKCVVCNSASAYI